MPRAALVLILLASLTAGARAEQSPAIEQKTLEAFGTANASCQEWTDGCAVCARKSGDTFACSLPGIACQPEAIACRVGAPAK